VITQLFRKRQDISTETSAPEQGKDYLIHGEFKLKVAYDPVYVGKKAKVSIENGSYERYEGRNLMRLIEDGDRIVELGAGLGFLSCLMLLNKNIAAYDMVEANPNLPPLMARTHALNNAPNIGQTTHNCVLTSNADLISAGMVNFNISKKFCASGIGDHVRNVIQQVTVPVRALSTFIAEKRPNVLVADIEGGETGLFAGADLSGITKILMEIHPAVIGQAGVRSIFRELDAHGFVFDPTCSAGLITTFRRMG
jgi:FkbM family methyltransferase